MANQADIERAQRGRDEWNAWAEANPGAGVDFQGAVLQQIGFAGFVFPGAVDFTSATLDARVSFKDTEFCDTAGFRGTSFLGAGDFCGATFAGQANFLGASFQKSAVDFSGITFLEDAIFAEASFERSVDFSGARFEKSAEFRAAIFQGDANFQKTNFSDGAARFLNAEFQQIAHFGNASFGKDGADFSSTKFSRYATFNEAAFAGYADFQRAQFLGGIAFTSTKLRGLAAFNDAHFATFADFSKSTFESVPTFHGAQLHEGTTFEAVAWPKCPHEAQSPYDAARAWARLRVEMNRLHKHEDEMFFFAKELDARTHDRRNEPSAKRLLYRIYLALGAGRSVAKPFGWLLGLNAVLFLPINWYATSAIQGRKLPIGEVLADIVSFNIPADVVSFTLGQALPFVGASNPERADLYRRLFARADSAGIDIPLWLEFVATFQQLVGVGLLFMIGLALRNRFRMK